METLCVSSEAEAEFLNVLFLLQRVKGLINLKEDEICTFRLIYIIINRWYRNNK
jgi:hypothetical protein